MVAAYIYRGAPPRLVPLLGGRDVLIPQAPSGLVRSPASGMPGDVITLLGSWIGNATSVKFNGTPAAFTSIDDSTVLATVPGVATSGPITLVTPLGSTTSAAFTVVPIPPPNTITPPVGFTTFAEDQYVDNSAGRWNVYDNNTFGAPTRIQRYMAANAIFGAGTTGATNGTSVRLLSKRELVGGNNFTAGMLDSKGVGVYYPRYGYFEFRTKTPHGHGLWPAWWMTAKGGGATTAEWDVLEYFHSQIPGRNSSTLHGTDNTGTFHSNRYTNNGAPGSMGPRTFFETPTYTPQWHKWATEILPVTDSTGNTIADVTQPSTNVRFRVLLDGVQVCRFVDTSALWWTSNGGSEDSFWNIYIQGCQIDGNYVGHPDGELAYSEELNQCLIGGSPGSCTKSSGGYNVIRAGAPGSTATMSDPATTFEIDYFYCAKYTG